MDVHTWLYNRLPIAPVIIEAGVCDGMDTKHFAMTYPVGRIYGFEPIPELFEYAKKVTNMYENVTLFQKALGENSGTSTIYISDINGQVSASSSILKPLEHLKRHPHVGFKQEIDVEVVNLDEWCSANQVVKADLIWLDIQGVEPNVIRSSPSIVSNTDYIYSEVSLIDTYDGVIKYDEFKKMMDELGFDVAFEDLKWDDMGNVMFQKRKEQALQPYGDCFDHPNPQS